MIAIWNLTRKPVVSTGDHCVKPIWDLLGSGFHNIGMTSNIKRRHHGNYVSGDYSMFPLCSGHWASLSNDCPLPISHSFEDGEKLLSRPTACITDTPPWLLWNLLQCSEEASTQGHVFPLSRLCKILCIIHPRDNWKRSQYLSCQEGNFHLFFFLNLCWGCGYHWKANIYYSSLEKMMVNRLLQFLWWRHSLSAGGERIPDLDPVRKGKSELCVAWTGTEVVAISHIRCSFSSSCWRLWVWQLLSELSA